MFMMKSHGMNLIRMEDLSYTILSILMKIDGIFKRIDQLEQPIRIPMVLGTIQSAHSAGKEL